MATYTSRSIHHEHHLVNDTDPHVLARQITDFIRAEIPLARAMDVHLHRCDERALSLAVPLPPNINDKGCAFGGSLVSLMTLAGWAWVELALRQRGEQCDVLVAESTVRYLAPVWSGFYAEARLPDDTTWESFFATLSARGKARIEVSCHVPGADGLPAATLLARFVAKRRDRR